MSLPKWLVNNNHDLGTFNERSSITQLPLPIDDIENVTTALISGELPTGLRLEDNAITGTPLNVAKATVSRFCIRATTSAGIADRTFTMTVEGADDPEWVTELGALPVGPNQVYFILDSSPIDFQLMATDEDLPTGQTLEYFIADGDGGLPPGITLSRDGRLTGVVDPLLALDINEIKLGYDAGNYGMNVYDWGATSEDTVDNIYYGDVELTNLELERPPRKLNRRYEFRVTVNDGTGTSKRLFNIFVISDDFARADNTIMEASSNVFVADMTYIRTPIWITPSDLGTRRANNYQTLYLDTLDQPDVNGAIKYLLKGSNPGTYKLTATGETVQGYWDLSGILPRFPDSNRTPDSIDDDFLPDPVRADEFTTVIPETISVIPDGLTLDPDSGELAGILPYQPAVTTSYKFSVGALRYDEDKGVVTVFGTYNQDLLSGTTILRVAKLPTGLQDGIDDLNELVGIELEIEGRTYTVKSVNNSNADYDEIILETPIQPLYSLNPIVVREPTIAGKNYFFADKVTPGDTTVISGRELRFSDSEIYTIKDIFDYSKYKIFANVGQDLELRSDIVPFDTDLETSIQEHLKIVTGRDAYITVNGNEATLFVATTATTSNRAYIASLFHTSDSSGVSVDLLDTSSRLLLDINLQRDFAKGRNITFGVLRGNSFNKSFPVDEIDIVESVKTFDLKVLGEVDSVITWITPTDFGSIKANRTSLFRVEALTSLSDSKVKYTLVSGQLPYGLTLKENGEIVGSVPITGTVDNPGITRIDGDRTTFDGATTSMDRLFEFTVEAKDRLAYSAITKTFRITIDASDSTTYSNVIMKPYLPVDQRSTFENFVNDINVFDPKVLYRPSDPHFGVQKELKSLVFAGIETRPLGEYVGAVALNHKRKQFMFGETRVAVAKDPGTNNVLYEVVYVELIDPAKPKTGKAAKSFMNTKGKTITADSIEIETKDDQFAGGAGGTFFPITKKDNTVFNLTIESNSITVDRRSGNPVVFQTTGDLIILDRQGQAITIRATSVAGSEGRDETWRYRPINTTVKADNTGQHVSENSTSRHYISNIDNMRDRINDIGSKSKDFLPLWMQTAQEESLKELGYVLAVPLVYVKAGEGTQTKAKIDNINFDFKKLKYEIDRYIVDAVQGDTNEQYVIFGNYAYNA